MREKFRDDLHVETDLAIVPEAAGRARANVETTPALPAGRALSDADSVFGNEIKDGIPGPGADDWIVRDETVGARPGPANGGESGHGDDVAYAAGGAGIDKQCDGEALSDPRADLIAEITVLERLRLAARRNKRRIQQNGQATVASALAAGDPALAAAGKKARYDAAAQYIAVGLGVPAEDALTPLGEFVRLSANLAEPFARFEAQLARQIDRLVRRLPVWDGWARDVKGLGTGGIGLLVLAGGDPLAAPSPDALRKFLGLAPPECYPQGETGGRKVPRQKKSLVLYEIVDSAIKRGPYAAKFQAARVALWAARPELRNPEFPEGPDPKDDKLKLTLRGHRLAMRKAADALIEDYWRAWRACGDGRDHVREAAE